MKVQLINFVSSFLILMGIYALILGGELPEPHDIWVRIVGAVVLLSALDWRINTLIRRSRADV